MIWLIWRQHRTEAFVAILVGLLLLPFLLFMHHTLEAASLAPNLAACVTQHSPCQNERFSYEQNYTWITNIAFYLTVLPLLVGIFIGAPLLAGELEQKTHLLIWAQSITRSRWLFVKLGVLVGAIILVFAIQSIFLAWWSSPWNAVVNPWSTYDLTGFVPVAYALFAFALGMASGTILRKTIPAMVSTIFVFIIIRLAVAKLLRPYLLPPVTYLQDPLQNLRAGLGDWVIVGPPNDVIPVDHSGHWLSDQALQACGNGGASDASSVSNQINQCWHDHGIFIKLIYHPVGQFWWIQGLESLLFLVLAAGLVALTFWWVKKRPG